MKVLGSVLACFGVICALYFGATAYLGYRVGVAIAQAEQSVLVRDGVRIAGHELIERYAIRRSGIPHYLVESPTFWLLLRRTE
jgi:hypothetical protein